MRSNVRHATTKPETRKRFALSNLDLRGHGALILHLKGRGHLEIWRGRGDHFEFDGHGLPRNLSSTHIRMATGQGRVTLTGSDLRVRFSGGCLDIEVDGCFHPSPEARAIFSERRAPTRGPQRRIQWASGMPSHLAWCSKPG